MRFVAKTDEELAKSGLMEDGVYDFEIASAEEKTSSKGNAMLEVKLNVFEADGTIRNVRDWIMPQMAKKFKHFHNATGMMDKYESGNLEASDVIGKAGKCMIKTEPYTNKDGIEMFSNKVDDYVKRDNLEEYSKEANKKPVDLDDDIPF